MRKFRILAIHTAITILSTGLFAHVGLGNTNQVTNMSLKVAFLAKAATLSINSFTEGSSNKFAVKGSTRSKESKVAADNWSKAVFSEENDQSSCKEVNHFIMESALHDKIPTIEEASIGGGSELADMNILSLNPI